MVEARLENEFKNYKPEQVNNFIPNTEVEFNSQFIEPDERARLYGYTKEFKQTQFTRAEAYHVEIIAQCERLTQMISDKLRENANDPEPLGELLDLLDSMKISKAMVNCGVDGFTAKLSRSHETKITEKSEQSINEQKKRIWDKLKGGGQR